ncbi:root allergen protein-like [Rutidosis leptorrhynchoides]|uniref:root allergen protein-like n=1 Tax=Rutidosis leptorrhynchoides TaxID=125765 RepID=UPI003A9A1CE4
MAVVTVEMEFTSPLPAPKLFNVYSDFDNIATKVEPETYKSINIIQGDGGVGSIRSTTYADGYRFKGIISKVDAIDKTNLSLSNTGFEGDALMGIVDTATHHIKFVPSSDGGSISKHTVELKCKGDSTLGEDTINFVKEACGKTFKAIESYVNAHPEAY